MKKLLKDKQDADKVVSYIRNGTEDTKLRENASMELYEKIQSPITSRIEKLEHKMEDVAVPFMYDRLMNQNQLSIEDYQQHFIEAPKQKTVTFDITKDINKDVLTKYKIPFKYNSKDEIEIIKNVVISSRNEISQRKTKITNENKQLQKLLKNKKLLMILKMKINKK